MIKDIPEALITVAKTKQYKEKQKADRIKKLEELKALEKIEIDAQVEELENFLDNNLTDDLESRANSGFNFISYKFSHFNPETLASDKVDKIFKKIRDKGYKVEVFNYVDIIISWYVK